MRASASLIDFTPPWAVKPPSTGISAPVMKELSSLTRKSTRGATSSTVPVRPRGVSATLASRNTGVADAVIGVSM